MRKIACIILSVITLLSAAALFGCGSAAEAKPETRYNIVISATELTIEKGESAELIASYGDKIPQFSSSDESVATVSENGTIKAVGEGTAYIRVFAGEKEKTCKVTVVSYVWSIELDAATEITAVKSLNKEFNAVVKKDGAKTEETVKWNISSADCGIETNGNCVRVFTGKAGVYTLTATYKNVTATCVITVTAE